MKCSLYGDRDHPGKAATLHALGQLSRVAGDLPAAKQLLEESLRMKCSLYGDRDHPGKAATLHALGQLSREAGDLPLAKQQLEEPWKTAKRKGLSGKLSGACLCPSTWSKHHRDFNQP